MSPSFIDHPWVMVLIILRSLGVEELLRKVEGDEEMERLGQELALSGITPGNPILLTG